MNAAFSTTNLVALLSSIPAGSIANVLAAHVTNGTVVYSNEMQTGTEVTPLGGTPLRFISNATGTFVAGEFSTAKILIPDVPISCVPGCSARLTAQKRRRACHQQRHRVDHCRRGGCSFSVRPVAIQRR